MGKSITEKIKAELWKRTKAFKYQACCKVYQAEFMSLNSVNQNCREFEISKKSYCLWKKRHGLFSSKQVKTGLFDCVLPTFNIKINPDALFYILKFKAVFEIAVGVNHIRKWIWKTYQVRISNKTIRFLKKKNPNLFPLLTQKKKYLKEVPNLRIDQVRKDYSTNKIQEKVGMDGTWFKELFIGGKNIKILGEMAYDWKSKQIVAWGFSHSENTTIVNEVLTKLSDVYLGNLREGSCIVQMDRGSANTSYQILSLEKEKSNFVISMSEAGFKHNSPTESLNRWIKERFYKTYGYWFKSIKDFIKTFANFVIQHNKLQNYFEALELS